MSKIDQQLLSFQIQNSKSEGRRPSYPCTNLGWCIHRRGWCRGRGEAEAANGWKVLVSSRKAEPDATDYGVSGNEVAGSSKMWGEGCASSSMLVSIGDE